MSRRPTYVQTLRALSNDRVRGLWCLAKAEQARHRYDLGQFNAQETSARSAGQRTAVTDARGSSAWGSTAEARDLRQDDVMFSRWADTYLHAYQAEATARMLGSLGLDDLPENDTVV